MDDEKIELAEPSYIRLSQDEAAEAVRLLTALIRAARSRPRHSTQTPPGESSSGEDLAFGSPSAPRNNGNVASPEAAGGEQ